MLHAMHGAILDNWIPCIVIHFVIILSHKILNKHPTIIVTKIVKFTPTIVQNTYINYRL